MGRWSRALAPLLLDFVDLRNGDNVLDVGTGTGALAAAILSRFDSTRVTGIDPSNAYIEYATSRVKSGRASFQVGDGQKLRFSDAAFDKTLSLLVMNFIPSPGTALKEMTRVTRPSGTVAAAVWDYGEGMEMLRAFWDEAVAIDPAIEKKDERHMPLCRRGELAVLWREHGLLDVREEPLVVQMEFASFDDFWSPFLKGQGPAGAYVATLCGERRQILEGRLRKRLQDDAARPFRLHARAWAVRGTVPRR